jgi:diaminohydroxyphosphoribosylaminopyrimidine deaminase/5-amino-6-(5-phosphoribosylamino)uracil reductase
VRLGDLNAYGLHRGVLFQDRGGYPFGYRLGQVDGRPFDDLLGPPVDFAVVHRSRQVIGTPRRSQVETQLDVYDKGLPQIAFGGNRPMAAVEDHALQQYTILARRVFFAAIHPAQYDRPWTLVWSQPTMLTFNREDYEEEEITRPTVTVSYAQTLDGRLATASGSSRWISSPESLRFTHAMRSEHDAIMVGAGTACKDDPRLTVRLVAGEDPLRVVVDSTLRTPLTAAVLANGAAKSTVLAVTARAPADRCDEACSLGATVLRLPTDVVGRVDLNALLVELHALGVGSVMVEGGAALITSFLCNRLVDRLSVCVAPKILGSGIEAVGDLGICDLTDSLILTDTSIVPSGVDIVLDSRIEYPGLPDGR